MKSILLVGLRDRKVHQKDVHHLGKCLQVLIRQKAMKHFLLTLKNKNKIPSSK